MPDDVSLAELREAVERMHGVPATFGRSGRGVVGF